MVKDDVDLVLHNLDLILQNKDRLLSNNFSSKCKISGTGIYYKHKHIFVGFNLENLIGLWSSRFSCWKYGKYYTYKMVIFGDGTAEIYAKTKDGLCQKTLIDADLLMPHIEDAVILGKVITLPKNIKDVISELKEMR